MKLKEFLRRWKEGIEGSTIRQRAEAKLKGQWVMLFGLCFATTVMIAKGLWYFLIVMCAAIFLTSLDMLNTRIMIKQARKVEDMMPAGTRTLQEVLKQEDKQNG